MEKRKIGDNVFVEIGHEQKVFHLRTTDDSFVEVVGYLGEVNGVAVGVNINESLADGMHVVVSELSTGGRMASFPIAPFMIMNINSDDKAREFFYNFLSMAQELMNEDHLISINKNVDEWSKAPEPEELTEAKAYELRREYAEFKGLNVHD